MPGYHKKNRSEITFSLLILLFILGVSSLVGIGYVINKDIGIANLITRARNWFSATYSAFNYGVYKLHFLEAPAGETTTIPYFGGENLTPFFSFPFTISIYGPLITYYQYKGYFGFTDLLYPVQWLFEWFVVREKGSIQEIEISPVFEKP